MELQEKMRPDTAPVGARLLLRANNESTFEVEVVEWAQNGRAVRLSNMKGQSYWRSDFDAWTIIGVLPPAFAPPKRPTNCRHPGNAVKADILEGDGHMRVQWCEMCGAFRFHWPDRWPNSGGEPDRPKYSEWREPRPDYYEHGADLINGQS